MGDAYYAGVPAAVGAAVRTGEEDASEPAVSRFSSIARSCVYGSALRLAVGRSSLSAVLPC